MPTPRKPLSQDGARSRNELIESCQGLVRNLAWTIHQKVKRHVDLEDLICYGQVGLIEAADRYDPTQGARFTTFAYHRIRGAIFDGLSKMGWFSRASFHAGRYERMADEVLADMMPEDESADLKRDASWLAETGSQLFIVYMLSELSGEREDAGGGFEDPSQTTPDHRTMRNELREVMGNLIDRLPEQAQALIRGIYYEGVSLTMVSRRLKISKSWASRLHYTILGQLASGLKEWDARGVSAA